MIVWSGWGFLVAIVGVALWGVGFVIGTSVAPGTPLVAAVLGFVGAIGAGVAIFFAARKFEGKVERTLIDQQTGQEVVLRRNAGSLFFIPTRFWAYIVPALGAGLSILMLTPTPPV